MPRAGDEEIEQPDLAGRCLSRGPGYVTDCCDGDQAGVIGIVANHRNVFLHVEANGIHTFVDGECPPLRWFVASTADIEEDFGDALPPLPEDGRAL